jgi:CMP-N-acetylneuraminic acid synthetase
MKKIPNKRPEVLGVILARGGSKGVPGKNIKPLGGICLIGWTISAAKKSGVLGRILVSTDDDEIACASRKLGAEVPFIRPARLATDKSSSLDAVLHALDFLKSREGYEPEFTFLLQPTSPFRSAEDIRRAVDILKKMKGFNAVVGICPASKHPTWMCTLDKTGMLVKLLPGKMVSRRQDLPPVYSLNGAIFLIRTSVLRKEKTFYPKRTYGQVMPEKRSVDIDTIQDFLFAEFLLSRKTL